ncbi:hypothetical protein BGZ75_003837 [Mortierella antarctica]|nr:hypothetical protein BGZ75_003837 [Mortierella antarctica]
MNSTREHSFATTSRAGFSWKCIHHLASYCILQSRVCKASMSSSTLPAARLVPISYLTIKRSGHSTQAAILCAILVTFENALITQSRFIFLDAPMLLFMGYTMLAWINFYNHRNRPFTTGWWTWLLQTGLSLFLSASVKWIGLFTLATIGLCLFKYLQESRRHLYLNTRDFCRQLLSLCACLIILPFVLYVSLFLIDINLLSGSGQGDSWASSLFRMKLIGYDTQPSPIHADKQYYGNRGDQSHPASWPFLRRGINYYSSKETNNYVYLIGNPLVWWATTITAVMYMCGCFKSATMLFRRESGSHVRRERFGLTPFYSVASGTFFVSWAVHYAPFFFMDHGLYLYQYLPSLYFSILLFVSRVDRAWQHWPTRRRYCIGLLLILAVIYSWHSLSPLAYGNDFSSRSRCERVRSLGGWEFVCQRQNLAYARPQAAAAKIVIEDRAEHEKHEEAEKWNSQFYYHAATAMDLQNDNAQEDQTGQENHEHDHEGPFSEEESEHYEHEHFRHPQGHGHVDQNQIPVERMNKAADPGANVNTAEEEEERRLLAEKKALDARQKELEELLLARQRAHEQRLQEQQQEQLKAQDSGGSSQDPSGAIPVQTDKENQHTQDLPRTDQHGYGHRNGVQENLRAQVLAMQGQIEYAPAV